MRFSYLFIPLAFALPNLASANTCEVAVSSNDSWAYDTKAISIPAECKEFTVNFSHNGQLSKEGLGHNWVLAKTADVNAIAQDGGTQGLENNFLPQNDARIIASTPIIGGGESASTTFKTSALDANESYTFFCSFPGHTFMMRGTVKVAQ
ncbi:azurin [Methylophaga sp. OBS3]|uniref:azurin n=1 Tax=Methylophaga sp. OBS3 TaxID=2991934 RepID=UPI0022525871|nr:azurin [Methylophaga sp. OBS3]MCX4190501.1 azurin [Methylophaga sp. OBS3]